MNETTSEQLSALMDGELQRDELRFLLRRMDADSGVAQSWSRYHVARAVFRHEPMAPRSGDAFAAAVLARLDADVVAARPRMTGRLARWVGGGAIAASVAVIALVATQPGGRHAPNATDGGAGMAVAPAPAAAAASPFAELSQPLPAGSVDSVQPASFESIVPSYVPRYSSAPSAAGNAEGFVPYVLVVGARQPLEPQPVRAKDQPARH